MSLPVRSSLIFSVIVQAIKDKCWLRCALDIKQLLYKLGNFWNTSHNNLSQESIFDNKFLTQILYFQNLGFPTRALGPYWTCLRATDNASQLDEGPIRHSLCSRGFSSLRACQSKIFVLYIMKQVHNEELYIAAVSFEGHCKIYYVSSCNCNEVYSKQATYIILKQLPLR